MTYDEIRFEHAAQYEALELALKKIQPKSYLEIGVSDGHSLRATLELASGIKRLVLCDNWGNTYGGTGRGNALHILGLLADLGFHEEVSILNGDSAICIPQLKETFDLILVDGDHSEAHAKLDLYNSWPLLNEGGVLIFDDVEHPAHLYLSAVYEDFLQGTDDAVEIFWGTDLMSGSTAMQKVAL